MRYVIAIHESGGFEAAAQRLRMSQPPLSRQIRALERELGVALFHRRPTRLTAAGQVFVDSAREVLAAADQAVERTRLAGLGEIGLIRLGYTVTTAFEEMPALFAALADRHPEVPVQAREGWDSELATALDKGELDLVLGRHVVAPQRFHTAVMRPDRLAVFVGAGHRLAGRDSIALRELRGETLLFFPRTFAPHYYDAVLSAVSSAGEKFEVWENPLPGLRNLVVSLRGTGFMVMPRSLDGQIPGAVCLPVTDPLGPVDLELAWPRQVSARVRPLVRTARKLARERGWLDSAGAAAQHGKTG